MSAPIELALAAWGRNTQDRDRDQEMADAALLGETGMFSVAQIVAITGCTWNAARDSTEKSNKQGGKLDPNSLDAVYEVWLQVQEGERPAPEKLREAVRMGCGVAMLARLTELRASSIYYWLTKEYGTVGSEPINPSTEGQQQ